MILASTPHRRGLGLIDHHKPAGRPGTPLQRLQPPASPSRSSGRRAANYSPSAGPSQLESVLSAPTPQLVLEGCSRAWPGWARGGFRLLSPGGSPVADAPTSQEAAAVLKAVAKRALKLPARERAISLSRHRVVLGLVEGLRAALPRGAVQSDTLDRTAWGGPAHNLCAAQGAVAAATAAAGPPAAVGAKVVLGPGELSGALWSLAVLGEDVEYEAEMRGLLTLLPAVEFGSLQEVADVCWALGIARHWTPHLPLLEQEAVRLVEAALRGSAVAPSTHASAAGDRKGSSSNGGDGRGGTEGSLSVVGSSQVAGAAWGLSVLGHPPLDLLGLLPALLRHWEAERGEAQGGSSTLGRQAQGQRKQEGQGQQRGKGQAAARQASRRRGASFSSLCTLAWAMAVSGQLQQGPCIEPSQSLLSALARSTAAEGSISSTGSAAAAPARAGRGVHGGGAGAATAAAVAPSQKQLMQLQQVALALDCWSSEAGKGFQWGSWLQLLPPQEAAALQPLFASAAEAAAGFARDGRNQKVSTCQADVASTLASLGLSCQQEYQVAPGLVVDAAVPGLMLAVEVDGPSHFTRNLASLEGRRDGDWPPAGCGRRPVGATLLKHRLLRAAGWRVARVETTAWERLRGPAQKRQALEASIAAAEVGGQGG